MNGRYYVGDWLVEPEQGRVVRGSGSRVDSTGSNTDAPRSHKRNGASSLEQGNATGYHCI